MSFMGSTGFIMGGSGLTESFCELYAENSVDKILNGHAYARAVRGHLLVHLALSQIILSSFSVDDNEIELIKEILTFDGENILSELNSDEFKSLHQKFLDHVEKLRENGPTAKLWLQYFDAVTIMKQFIESERSGKWDLHLQSVRRMLPYFHASGHFLYAKSCHLYLQDMYNLETEMDVIEYDKFTNESYFTVRRSEKFWGGVWTDMCIEQIPINALDEDERWFNTRSRNI